MYFGSRGSLFYVNCAKNLISFEPKMKSFSDFSLPTTTGPTPCFLFSTNLCNFCSGHSGKK